MKLSEIVSVVLKKYLGHRKEYVASFLSDESGFSFGAKNKDDALAGLLKRLQNLVKYNFTREYYFSKSGKTVFVLYHQFGGWAYDIMRPEYLSPSSCGFAEDCSLEKARESVKNHAAQYEE